MDSISKDILIYLMKLLPPRDILALGAACRRFHGLSKDELLWRFLLRRDFGVEPIYGDSALEIYKEEYDCAASNESIPYLDILYGACEYGQLGDARCALRHGADPEQDSLQTIDMAVYCGHLDIAKLLLDDGRAYPSYEIIMEAIGGGDIEMVKLLLSYPEIDVNDEDGQSLVLAIQYSRVDIVEFLLQNDRVDPSADNNWAVRYAAREGKVRCLRLLLQHPKVDPTALANEAIRRAACQNNCRTVQILLEDERVDPTDCGNFAFYKTVQHGNVRCARLLLNDARVYSTVDFDKALAITPAWDREIEALLRQHKKRKRK